MVLPDGLRQASAVVRAIAAEVSRQSQEIAARWPDSVPDLVAAETRLDAEVTALEGEPLLDGAELLRGGRALGLAAEAVEPGVGQTMLAIVARLEALDERSLGELARVALAGAWEPVVSLAAMLDLDEYAVVSVVDYAARPALIAAAGRAGHLLVSYDHASSRCPICGSPPLLAELSGKDGARSLRCARCGARWRYPRLACVWCGERDPSALSALHGEGEAGVRQADCCNRCHGYLKAVSVLDSPDYVGLLRIDLETAGLDLAAVARGYSRGSGQRGLAAPAPAPR
jgi:FdhE protein